MARDDEYFGNDNQDHFQGGHQNRTPSFDGRKNLGHTSDFNTTFLSEDGRFLGIQLTPQMADQFNMFSGAILDIARRKVENFGIPIAEKFAKGILKANEHDAAKFAARTGNVLGYGTILINPLLNVGQNVISSANRLNDLRVAVAPLSKTAGPLGHLTPLSSNNEVVANARAKISGIFWQKLTHTVTGAITSIPALAIKWNEQTIKNRRQQSQWEYEKAKNNPEELKKLAEKELKLTGISTEAGITRDVIESVIEDQKKSYERKFEEFKRKNKSDADKDFKDLLTKLNGDNVYDRKNVLKRYDLETYPLDKIKTGATESEIREAVRDFKKINSRRLDKAEENSLKAKFVRQYGAFDGEWERYRNFGDERKFGNFGGSSSQSNKTIRETLEEKFEKYEQARLKAKEEDNASLLGAGKDGAPSEISRAAAGFAGGLVSKLATQTFVNKFAELSKPIAIDRILHLRRKLENVKREPPALVPAIEKSDVKQMGYAQYVHEIFQQHQKDCNRAEIGDRYFEQFEKARWDDSSIFQTADDELSAYEFAVKTIAKRIRDGRMDPIALINLVGDRDKKIVNIDGNTFGPRNAGSDDASVKKAIGQMIDEQSATLQQKQTREQRNEQLGNFLFSIADLRKALESNELESSERAFIFTLFSNVVGSDVKLCQQLGISNGRCKELREEAKGTFNVRLDAAVEVLADMLENNPQELEKKLKLTDKEKKLLLSLAERVESEGKDVADLTDSREEIKMLETLIANAAMALHKDTVGEDENGKPQGFWTQVAQKAQSIPQRLKDIRKGREPGNDDNDRLDEERNKTHDPRSNRDFNDSYREGNESGFVKRFSPNDRLASARGRELKRRHDAEPSDELTL